MDVSVVPYHWSAAYPNGMWADEIVLPLDRWVQVRFAALPISSMEPASDHRLHVPDLGWTLSIPAGDPTVRWVRARRVFSATSECVESCGDYGEQFVVTVEGRDPDAFQAWLDAMLRPPDGLSWAQWGAQLSDSSGCSACHGGLAGALSDVWGQERSMPDGSTVTVRGEAGRTYVRAWLERPGDFGAAGGSAMPSFAGLPPVHADALIEHIRCGDVPTCPPEPSD